MGAIQCIRKVINFALNVQLIKNILNAVLVSHLNQGVVCYFILNHTCTDVYACLHQLFSYIANYAQHACIMLSIFQSSAVLILVVLQRICEISHLFLIQSQCWMKVKKQGGVLRFVLNAMHACTCCNDLVIMHAWTTLQCCDFLLGLLLEYLWFRGFVKHPIIILDSCMLKVQLKFNYSKTLH